MHIARSFVVAPIAGLVIVGAALSGVLGARQRPAAALAPAPPLGWNSWDSYGLRIDESQFRANVEALAAKLKPAGYTYAVIDEGWYMVNPEDRPRPQELQYQLDAYGRFIPVPARFPASMQGGTNTGFEALATWVHASGLKFGIHVIRGIPRESVRRNLPIEGSSFMAQDAADQSDACPWDPTSWGIRDNAAGQAWYDSLLRQYAAWGVDFIKVDCIANNPYKVSEIRQLHRAIAATGRDIVLSLSPGPTQLEHQAEVAELSQMWRISNDVWDVWDNGRRPFPIGIAQQFDNAARWAPYAGPGHWPDADMLPVGELRPYPDVGPGPRHTRLTPVEQQTQLSLWAMARSPLIVGANLTLLDDDTVRLLTNADILRIDQTATASRQVLRDNALVAWTADLPGGQHAVAVFNLGETPLDVDLPFSRLGLPEGPHDLTNAWSGAHSAAAAGVKDTLEPHASRVLLLGAAASGRPAAH
jgi:alpha-galactosidase